MNLENNNNITTFSIDRFEENFAVCENRKTGVFVNIPIIELPPNCTKGSILKFENGKYILDQNLTQKKQSEIKNMVNNLFKKK